MKDILHWLLTGITAIAAGCVGVLIVVVGLMVLKKILTEGFAP